MEEELNGGFKQRCKKVSFQRVKRELKRSIRLHENCIIAWKRRISESESELEKYQKKLDELREEYKSVKS
jgi:hypothetical protein